MFFLNRAALSIGLSTGLFCAIGAYVLTNFPEYTVFMHIFPAFVLAGSALDYAIASYVFTLLFIHVHALISRN